VYHSAALCKIGSLNGMIIFFGGRASEKKNQVCLNDAWGLRRDKQDRWEWIRAPCKNTDHEPEGCSVIPRCQHSAVFINTLMVIIGGRTDDFH